MSSRRLKPSTRPSTSLGHVVDRIGGVKKLSARLAAGDRWDLVFNYAEGMFGFAREAQVPALLDAFQIPYTFSDGLVFALTLHKGMTKHIVREPRHSDAGLRRRFESVRCGRRQRPVPGVRQAGRRRIERRRVGRVARSGRRGPRVGVLANPRHVSAAGAGRNVSAGPRSHGWHRRHRITRASDRRHGSDLHARCRGPRVLVREQEAREGSIRNRQRRGGRGGGRHRAARLERTGVPRPGPRGLPLRSSMAARSFSRSIRSPACIPCSGTS